ncbi:MAG TPA: ATP-binding protein [Thermoanaerobaculia bacterium]|nr:ATP-binding protein [Thermoanaerobaculia bacterium]
MVLEGASEWSTRLQRALRPGTAPGADRHWEVATIASAEDAAGLAAERGLAVWVVAPDRLAEWRSVTDALAGLESEVGVIALGDGASCPDAPWAGEASEWLAPDAATPDRLRAVCERQRELIELRSEVDRWRRRFRDLYDRSLTGLYRIDGTGTVIEANETFASLLGFERREDVLGSRLEEFVDREEEPRSLRRDAGGRRPFWSRRVCLRRRDGSRLWGLMSDKRLHRDADVFEGSLIEATREHDLTIELLRQEALYVEIFGAMTEPTLLLDETGVVLACNNRAEALLGRPALELVGRSLEESVVELLSADGDRVPLTATPLLPEPGEVGAEESLLGMGCQDGRTLWLMVRSRRIPAPGPGAGAQILVSMVDRTELRELSQRAQRAEVEGLLTQGLVHDVRNLLTAVRAAAGFLELQPADPEEVASYAGQIDRVADRANKLLTRALAHAQRQQREEEDVAVDDLITSIAPVLRKVLGDKRLRLQTGAPGGVVRGDCIELEQVLVNLLANARDAIESEGEVTLRTLVVPGTEAGGPVLRLEVEDDGCGMTEEVRERAFEPLFTSKRSCGGTGLGLFNVALITRSMRGTVALESESGRGTLARIDLPLACRVG